MVNFFVQCFCCCTYSWGNLPLWNLKHHTFMIVEWYQNHKRATKRSASKFVAIICQHDNWISRRLHQNNTMEKTHVLHIIFSCRWVNLETHILYIVHCFMNHRAIKFELKAQTNTYYMYDVFWYLHVKFRTSILILFFNWKRDMNLSHVEFLMQIFIFLFYF
jgi:hypothetical protein